jgi:hypothetical protein
MFRHSMFYLLILAAAVGIPYFSTDWSKTNQWFSSKSPTSEAPPGGDAANAGNLAAINGQTPAAAVPNLSPFPAEPTKPNTTPVVDLAEALRLEVTSSWVLGRWPRVTAGLPDADLQGYRVPLLTGTREDDIAGSLTYYFNRQQRCARITFQGTTGDARRLIAYLEQRYGFKQQQSNDPNLYLYQIRWNGNPLSELHIRPARVIKADAPMARFEVLLALNDQGAK